MQDDFGLMQIKTPVIQIPDEKNSIYIKRDDLKESPESMSDILAL